MKYDVVREQVEKTLREVLHMSGQECPPVFGGEFCPLDELDGFDSILSVEATVMIEADLKFSMKEQSLFFTGDKSPRALSIDEIVSRIMKESDEAAVA